MAVTTIDEAIEQCGSDIAHKSYGGVSSLYTLTVAWITGMFGTPAAVSSGIFPPNQNATLDPGQRVVTNWLAAAMMARDLVQADGTGIGDAGVEATSAVIDAVVRSLYAVKYGVTDNNITTAQSAAVIALYNATWV